MIDIVTFLTARLDEDEAVARTAADFENDFQEFGDEAAAFADRFPPARILAEVKAKREILSSYAAARAKVESHGEMPGGVELSHLIAAAELGVLRTIVRDLAEPYADHPDYDQT